jgi:hypothetical protein
MLLWVDSGSEWILRLALHQELPPGGGPGALGRRRPGTGERGQTRRRPMDARGIHHAAPTRMP